MLWKGSNGPKTLLTCIIHDNKSNWPTLGPFRYPRRALKGPFGPGWPPIGRNWQARQKMLQKGSNGPKTLLTCIIHDNKSYWPTLGPFWYPRRAQKGPFGPGWPPTLGSNVKVVVDLSSDLSKQAREGHLVHGKRISLIRHNSKEKSSKNHSKCHLKVVFGIFLLTGKSDWANFFPISLVPLSRLFW